MYETVSSFSGLAGPDCYFHTRQQIISTVSNEHGFCEELDERPELSHVSALGQRSFVREESPLCNTIMRTELKQFVVLTTLNDIFSN